jgi:hypothetical protein
VFWNAYERGFAVTGPNTQHQAVGSSSRQCTGVMGLVTAGEQFVVMFATNSVVMMVDATKQQLMCNCC